MRGGSCVPTSRSSTKDSASTRRTSARRHGAPCTPCLTRTGIRRPWAYSGGNVRRVRPAPLRKGDVIAVVAPGGPVDPARLARGLARLSAAGFVPETAEGLLERDGDLAGGGRHRGGRVA